MDNINLVFDALVIKAEEGGFWSLCLDLNVASQGETIEQAKNMLIEAVEGYTEACIENDIPYITKVENEDNPLINEKENVALEFKIKTDLKIHTHV
jgi:predicted RNase H-like HicB family nuclease